jgi:hypothetical protein
MPIVDEFNVHAPKKITLTTTPGTDVTGYSARLFLFEDPNDPNAAVTLKETWHSNTLAGGATFDFDATGTQVYQISLAATANKATNLDTTVTFSSGIGPSHNQIDLLPNTLNELIWNFVPV